MRERNKMNPPSHSKCFPGNDARALGVFCKFLIPAHWYLKVFGLNRGVVLQLNIL